MIVAQLSDTHILSHDTDRPAAELRADCLARCVADINRLAPDAVVLTGDTVQHGRPDEYARLRDLLAPLAAPLHVIPGNRDDADGMRAAFPDHAYLPQGNGFLHYVIEDFEVRLVGIDSTLASERKGRFCGERQEWLDGVLAAQPDRPTLLFIHHPPFDVGDHYVGGYRRAGEAAALESIVRRHAQVAGLLCGHVHWPVSRNWAGTEARIMPSVAADLRKGVDEAEVRGRPVYYLHRVLGAGRLDSELKIAGA